MSWLKWIGLGKPKNEKADKLTQEVAQQRNRVYTGLFELQKLDNTLDDMVKRSLELLETKK